MFYNFYDINVLDSLFSNPYTWLLSYNKPLQSFFLLIDYNTYLSPYKLSSLINLLYIRTDTVSFKETIDNSNYFYYQVIYDLFLLSSITTNFSSSIWYNEFLAFLDKPILPNINSKNNPIHYSVRDIFIEILLKKSVDRFLISGTWVLNDNNVLEASSPFFLKIIESAIILYLFFILCLFTSSTYITEKKDSIDYAHIISFASLQSEKEIGSVDDFLITCIFILFIFSWIINQLLAYKIFSYFPIIELGISGFIIFLSTLLLNLFFVLIDLGLIFLLFFRGLSKNYSQLYVIVLDYVFVSSYFARTIIQNSRGMLLYIFYFFYLHTVEDQSTEIFSSYLSSSIKENYNPPEYSYFLFFGSVDAVVQVLYEWFHISTITASQSSSFCSVIFWLFNTLYFSYETFKVENMIAIRRKYFRDKTKYNI